MRYMNDALEESHANNSELNADEDDDDDEDA